MSGFLNNGVKHLLHVYRFRFHVFYSTAAAATSQTEFLVETLVNSLGFSQREALSTSAKVSRLRPRNYNPNSVLNFLEHVGLDKTHIKKVVSSVPTLLLCDVDKYLKPKIETLKEVGLCGSEDLVKIIKNSGCYFSTRVGCAIRQNVDYLHTLLFNDDFVAKIIKRHPNVFFSYAFHEVMPPNISLLQNLGFSSVDIEKLMLWNPRILTQKAERLKDLVDRVEKTFFLSRDCNMFIHGVYALAWLDELTVKKRLEIFRSFGWSDSDIFTLVQTCPLCLTKSEAKIKNALNFLMKELGYESHYLASHPTFLTCSLEKRVLPRHNVLKLVSQKELTKCSLNLYTAVICSESKFLERYVLPFKDEMPEVYDLYIKSRMSIGR
nr:PREDICTED: uncharacterized protein LOC107782570 isoform X1 [Nicotiana tabacum]